MYCKKYAEQGIYYFILVVTNISFREARMSAWSTFCLQAAIGFTQNSLVNTQWMLQKLLVFL